MKHIEVLRGVVNGAVAIVVIADRAIEVVISEDAVEGFALRDVGAETFCRYLRSGYYLGSARTNQFPAPLDHAGVASLDGSHMRVVADLRKMPVGKRPVYDFDEQFSRGGGHFHSIDGDGSVGTLRKGRIEQPFFQ